MTILFTLTKKEEEATDLKQWILHNDQFKPRLFSQVLGGGNPFS